MSVFKRFVKTSVAVGYLGGLAFAGIEGLQAVLAIQLGPASKTLKSWRDISMSLAVPLAAYPVLGCVAAILVCVLLFPLLARRARSASPAGLTGLVAGTVAAAGVGMWALMTSNPFLNLASLISASRILFNLQTVAIGVLAGVGIGLVVHALCLRFSPGNVGLTFGAVWPSTVISAVLFLWAKRNLPLWHTTWKILAAVALVAVAFVVLTLVSKRALAVIYREHAGVLRRLALPVVLCAGSVAALASYATPRPHLLEGGRGGKGSKTILFSIDTLRADHLGCYGYHRATSPVMDSIATQGTLFWNARSQSPWTLSSISSFMTSTYPTVNAVLSGNNKLEETRITLAEQLQEHGILTQAVVTNGWLQDTFGMAQGYDGYHHSGEVFNWGRYQRMLWMRLARRFWPDLFPLNQTFLAKDAVDRAIDWIRMHHDRDFFLWIHTVDPHDPYQPPPEYKGLFEDTPYRGRFRETSGLINSLRTGARVTPEEKAHLQVLYDREIRYTDDQIGRLVQTLREAGIWDQTLFILTADHGEEFWDHDGVMHGHTLYDENLRVPLVFRMPGKVPAGKVVRDYVRLLDLMPTILDMWGVPATSEMEGHSLVPLIHGAASGPPPAPAFAEALLYYDELKSITDDGFKLVLNPTTGKTMLFDLENDPAERWDLARADTARVQSMLAELHGWMETSAALAESLPHSAGGNKARIDADTEAQLRALGYLN
ncbi:MAG: sulfatase [Candidatus Eisenbacteria bacterium]|jgi:arylsulfatase A-like enzyme|nr:sulfatase [Candidatus Eisenbacteria bacterium]